MRHGWLFGLLLLTGCTGTAMVAPLNPEAQQLGTPVVEFTRTGFGHGPVKVTMPGGEVLVGQFQIAEDGAFVTAFNSRGFSSTAFASSGGGNFWAMATGPKTTLACRGDVSFGHGGGECRTPQGAAYQVMF